MDAEYALCKARWQIVGLSGFWHQGMYCLRLQVWTQYQLKKMNKNNSGSIAQVTRFLIIRGRKQFFFSMDVSIFQKEDVQKVVLRVSFLSSSFSPTSTDNFSYLFKSSEGGYIRITTEQGRKELSLTPICTAFLIKFKPWLPAAFYSMRKKDTFSPMGQNWRVGVRSGNSMGKAFKKKKKLHHGSIHSPLLLLKKGKLRMESSLPIFRFAWH